jgi:uridine kinase
VPVKGVIAIAGGTCSGKSTLAGELSARLPHDVVVVPQDSFYPDRSVWPVRLDSEFNWDTLASFDSAAMRLFVRELASAESVEVPVYDRVSHSRSSANRKIAVGGKVVVFEGLHSIDVTINSLSSIDSPLVPATVFIECSEDERLRRRVAREKLYGSYSAHFLTFWENLCEPTFVTEGLAQRDSANIVLRSPWDGREWSRLMQELAKFYL